MTEEATSNPEEIPINKSIYYADCMDEILALIKARVPVIWVLTHEEDRFIKEFYTKVATPTNRQVWLWSSYQGLIQQENLGTIEIASGEEAKTNDAKKALSRISVMRIPEDSNGVCYIMRDFHTVLSEPIPRQIRDIFDFLMETNKTLIITSPMLAHGQHGKTPGLPPTLEKQISVVHYELPNKEIIEHGVVRNAINQIKKSKKRKSKKTVIEYTNEQVKDFTKALQGLTYFEAENSVGTSVTHLDRIDVNKLIQDKRAILRKSEILEFIDTPVGMEDVGGLDQAKLYMSRYADAYSDEAKAFGVDPLKGVLLTGIPGTGKSLLAKVIGKLWKVPLLRLDVGKVMTGLVGGSEAKMREVINQAEAMAPCVLWIDEVEKSLSGTKSSNFSDGGTLSRVFGTLLTAMQDGMEGVTLIATANDITMLPPEFIRRFNEVFFVDLPGPDERWEVFGIHLRKRGRDIKNFENSKSKLLNASHEYTGAEIEKAVKDAIAGAFYSGNQDLTEENLITALKDTKPISKVMSEKVKTLREKARGQYRYASSYAETQSTTRSVSTSGGKSLRMDDVLDDLDEFAKTPKEKMSEQSSQIKNSNRFSSLDDDK